MWRLLGAEGEEPVQPSHQSRSGRLAVDGHGGLTDGIDLVGVEGLEEFLASGEVAVQGRHADSGASRDLGHRHLSIRIGERGARGGEDLVAVALGVGSSRRCRDLVSGHRNSKWTSYPFVATVKWTGYPPAGVSDPIHPPRLTCGGSRSFIMEYRTLGRTGVSVSQLCLGAMMFGAFGNPDHDDAIKIIHKALDAGINFIDTADGYSAGESEEILGKALAGGRRESVVLAVKFGPPLGEDPNHRGASRRWITEGVEGSLRRLQTDWIDLYQVGVPDPDTDIDETLGALSDLVRAGKIRSFGASKVPASQIVEAQWVADRRGHGRFRTEQPPYSMLTRAIEYDVLPTCQRHGMGVMTYSPLAGGWLSGKYRKGQEVSGPGSAARSRRLPARYDASDPSNAAKLDAADALGALAGEAGLTLIQMAVAFVTRHPAVTSAIIGPRTMEHLDGYLAADGIDLTSDVLDRIDEIVPPGVTINVADNMWNFGTTALDAAFRRR